MFLRSILYPSLIACVIGAPMVMSSSWDGGAGGQNSDAVRQQGSAQWPTVSGNTGLNGQRPFTTARSTRPPAIQSQNAPVGELNTMPLPGQGAVLLNPAFLQATPASMSTQTLPPSQPRPAQLLPGGMSVPGTMISGPTTFSPNGPVGQPSGAAAFMGMTPDFGAAQTFVFPGDANGPNLTATPMGFVPVMNLEEIIRFDVFPNWVKSRWDRVSTNPGEAGLSGLHGLRVALVTGTNTWDLHGALSYYFDANQRAQRITFRGWTGDSTRLVNLLSSKWGFQAQPTHWAGCYAAEKHGKVIGGLLMQHPAVITRDNPRQQVALVLEMNNPQGSFEISDEVLGMLQYATQTRR